MEARLCRLAHAGRHRTRLASRNLHHAACIAEHEDQQCHRLDSCIRADHRPDVAGNDRRSTSADRRHGRAGRRDRSQVRPVLVDHALAEHRPELGRRTTLEARGRRHVAVRQAGVCRAGLSLETRPIPAPDTRVFLDVDRSLRTFADRSCLIGFSLVIVIGLQRLSNAMLPDFDQFDPLKRT